MYIGCAYLQTCGEGVGVDRRGLVGGKVRVGGSATPLDPTAERWGAGVDLGDAQGGPARCHPQGADDISARAGLKNCKLKEKGLRTSVGAMPREGSSEKTYVQDGGTQENVIEPLFSPRASEPQIL